MKRYLIRRWFLLTLVLVLATGILGASHLEGLVELRWLRHTIVAGVLFLMALPLRAGAMRRAIWPPVAPLLGVAVNFLLLPLFAWGVAVGLRQVNSGMAAGLLVAAATPCTLASAAVWTRRAGGNESVAILVTIITNLSCFVITPLWLFSLAGVGTHSISMREMVGQLAYLVVLPIVVAQALRSFQPLGHWATHHRIPLGVVAQGGVLAMIFLGAIQTGLRLSGQNGQAPHIGELALMAVAVLSVHLIMLAVGWLLAGLLRLPRADQIAVAIAGSQKTLMVGLQVAIESQITILPMVTYHVGQLFVDTLIADRLRSKDEVG